MYLVFGLYRSGATVFAGGGGRDYATYHYAVQEAVAGGDPYDTAALGLRSAAEGTRKSVHPFFYPPPFLFSMLWAAPLSLMTAYRVFWAVNQLLLVGTLFALRRWFGPSLLLLAFVAATFSPIPDNAKMGQANLLVLLLAVAGLARGSGGLVGAAAMAKMSPALYLVGWLSRREWRPVLTAGVTAIGLSLLALPLVPLETQRMFYLDILPGFSSGDYHGLKVKITLPANHSIPDLWNQLWPGPSGHALSPAAQRASSLSSLGLLGLLGLVGARTRGDADPLRLANLMGALTVLMLITPVYTYEHHLTLLILPVVALGAAIERGRLGRGWVVLVLVAYFFVAWPLAWLRGLQDLVPLLDWPLQESKFLGALLLGLANARVAWSPAPPAAADQPARAES
jgi:alpha-1,2-mannosyltransferase